MGIRGTIADFLKTRASGKNLLFYGGGRSAFFDLQSYLW